MVSAAYSLIIFDWDGTLADSEAKIVDCFVAAIAGLGWAGRERVEVRTLIGLALAETVPRLYPGIHSAEIERFVAEYRRHWLAPDALRVQLFDGAQDLLGQLRSRGHRLAIATGKSRAGLARELDDTGLASWFAATRCSDETRSKPHPAMLEAILTDTGVDPADALLVGDTTYDLEMAAAAGVASVGVTWGVHSADALRAWNPVTIVESMAMLAEHLASLRDPRSPTP